MVTIGKKITQLTSGNKFGHSAMCRARFTASGDGGDSPTVILLK